MENHKFKITTNSITTKKEYIDKRLKLKNSMIMFFGYNEEADVKENEEWFELLENLIEKFPKHLEIVTFTNKSEQKLVETLLDENEKEIKQITYPRAVLCHPHIIDPQLIKVEPFSLYKMIEEYDTFYSKEFEKELEKMFFKIKKLLSSFPVIIFIKGTPKDPFCKFSKSFMSLIGNLNFKYKSFDIFRDEGLRCYLRLYSGWKTYPQLYINGKIIGGVDVVKELVEKNKFMELIPYECTKEGVRDLIREFIKKNPLSVFGKGDKQNTKCKATKEVYEILDNYGFKYEIFDVLQDEMAREVVKEAFDYKFYPQIHLHQTLLGGVKFLKEVTQKNTIYEHVFNIFNKFRYLCHT